MSIFQRIKTYIKPSNGIITGVIILFIIIRVFLTQHENTFIIEEIVTTETQTKVETFQHTESTSRVSPSESVIDSSLEPQADLTELLAYSSELKKTFTLDAFNKLTKEELMTFSGIGEVTAQSILDYRRENGPFAEFNDLMLVKGIGEKKLQKIMTILP